MVSLVGGIRLEYRDFDKSRAFFKCLGESLDNAGVDGDLGIEYFAGCVRFGPTSIIWTRFQRIEGGIALIPYPAPGMILFIGWLMNVLPSRARVTWLDGWPHVYCPPNDDRDIVDDPTPLVPNELMPA